MRIVCIGGGPAGLYFALLMKKQSAAHDITVVERNRPYDTFGWGVVFSDQTMGNLEAADAETAREINLAFNHWDDIDVHFRGHTITSGGHGFCGIGRKRLLNILQRRCEDLGVRLAFEHEVKEDSAFADADLIIASDGANSVLRRRYAHAFEPDIDTRKCRYIWLGTHKRFDAFTFAFEQTEHGWFQAHAYQFDGDTSTFIVETPEKVWRAHGIDRFDQVQSVAFCERLFATYLDGHNLMTNARHLRGSAWIKFDRVICRTWVHHTGRQPIVLMGDAAHTAHFSVGSGTKLALEDAMELADCLGKAGKDADLMDVLKGYEDVRSVEVLKIQNAARNSTEWFENVARYTHLAPEQFAYSLLTRSQRISHENLRLRDRSYVEGFERWFARRTRSARPGLPPLQEPAPDLIRGEGRGGDGFTEAITQTAAHPNPLPAGEGTRGSEHGVSETFRAPPPPPMFTPFALRGIELKNRIVVSPMAQYSCVDGTPDDYYLVHLGSRAHGGAALVFTEMTCVSADARISPGCAGMYKPEHKNAWARIVNYVHTRTDAKVGLQLGHAGPKGSTQLGWEEADEPLTEGNWPLISPSAIPYGPRNQTPRAMTSEDMERVKADFVRATQWAVECEFDWLELHCAHGYLLSAFICPLTNARDDEYGGSLANRCRYPLEVFRAMRAAWPADKPMSVRISAHDWAPGGNTADDAVTIAQLFKDAGVDMIDVSSGQTTRRAKPTYGRMYQTPFADRIRNEVGVATLAVGAIFEADHANSIIASGRADLCALARPHLADPYWTLHAAAQLGYTEVAWLKQYLAGRDQLYRNLARAAQEKPQATSGQAIAAAREEVMTP